MAHQQHPDNDFNSVLDKVMTTLDRKAAEYGGADRRTARAAVYVRSVQFGGDEGVPEQLDACRAYIARSPWELRDDMVFSDSAESGFYGINGPAFQQVRRGIRNQAFDVLVVPSLLSLSPDHKTIDQLITEADEAGIVIVSAEWTHPEDEAAAEQARFAFAASIDIAATAENLVACIASNYDDDEHGNPDFTSTGSLILEGLKTVHPIGIVLPDIYTRAYEVALKQDLQGIADLFAEHLAAFGMHP